MSPDRLKKDASRRTRRRWLLGVLLAGAAIIAVAVWVGTGQFTRPSPVSHLPDLPDLSGEPLARAEVIRRADADARADPVSADRIGHLGMVYRANLYYVRAARCFDRAAELDPGGWRWMYHSALISAERGEVEAAAEKLRRIVQLSEDFALAWFRLGEAEFKLDHPEAAEKAFRQAAVLDQGQHPVGNSAQPTPLPVSAHARYQLARLAFRGGEHQRAAEILEGLLKVRADFGPARRQLARAYQALGRKEDAAAQTKRAAALPPYVPPPDPLFDELIDLSRSSTFLLKQAALAKRGRQYGRAEELIRRARDYEPEDLEVTFRLALILQHTGQAEEALPLFQEILEVYPDRVFALDGVAECLNVMGRHQEAIDYYRRIVELTPNSASNLNNLATALAAENRLGEAEQLFRKALDLDPGLTGSVRNLGRLLATTRRFDEAIDCYRRALADRQEDYDIRTDLGATLAMSGRLDEGIAELREALRFDPNYPPALRNLLSALLRRRRFAEALETADRLLRIMPKDASSHLRYAVAAANLDRKDDAIRHCRLALEANPKLVTARRLLNQLKGQED